MNTMKRWEVVVFIGEHDGYTYAEARLVTEIGGRLVGVGSARVSPSDFDVPEIGDEVAVARALSDLGHRLLVTAATDIEDVTHEPVRLLRSPGPTCRHNRGGTAGRVPPESPLRTVGCGHLRRTAGWTRPCRARCTPTGRDVVRQCDGAA
ncbi:MAG: DUF1876 domain-containing protein [Micromonosporaceae bacterium]|nr:DUF1876 domain-containing protein [Micromonosporaceae bacterium]